jgi:DNA topoisomerase IA
MAPAAKEKKKTEENGRIRRVTFNEITQRAVGEASSILEILTAIW